MLKNVLATLLDPSFEGMTIEQISESTGIAPTDIVRIIDMNPAFFRLAVYADDILVYARQSRFLKTAFTVWNNSDATILDFNFTENEQSIVNLLTDPRYVDRSMKALLNKSNLDRDTLLKTIADLQSIGIICRNKNRIKFTLLGLPIWAASIVARTFPKNSPIDIPDQLVLFS